MREYSTNLSVKGVQRLKAQIRKEKTRISRNAELLVKKLASKGVKIAKVKVSDYGAVQNGGLYKSIKCEKVSADKNGAIYLVKADCEYAIYVEMGTGLVGAGDPYPGYLPAVYNQGEHIITLKDGREGWYYKDDYGKWHFTQGMPSRPFMFDTTYELLNIIEETAKEVFEK